MFLRKLKPWFFEQMSKAKFVQPGECQLHLTLNKCPLQNLDGSFLKCLSQFGVAFKFYLRQFTGFDRINTLYLNIIIG
jgi:hypothetical protein